jgi:hypothetical protein
MRTTLNLDDDVAAQLVARSRESAASMSRVANELIRAGLRASCQPVDAPPYVAPTFDSGRPLVDVTDVAEALEALERAG